MHVVCAAEPAALAAAATLARALERARIDVAGLTVVGIGERVDSPTYRAWLADAPALLVVGLGTPRPLSAAIPQFAVDGERAPGAWEPLAARAFRLGATLAQLADASWCAAVGLVERAEPHALVEQALARQVRADLEAVAALLDAAARGAEPAAESLMAVEMLAAASDPRRFLASVPA